MSNSGELSDLIWIQDAVKEYSVSLWWFQEQIRNGMLDAYKLPGTKRQYLSRKQIEEAIKPRKWNEK